MMRGANPAAVQRILRHSDPKLTTEVYGHLAARLPTGRGGPPALPTRRRCSHGIGAPSRNRLVCYVLAKGLLCAAYLGWPHFGGCPYDRVVTREEALRRLSEHRAELERFGVRSLDLFGSVARGDSGPGSHVDLLVDFDKPVGLFHFFRVQRRLEAILGRPVDLVMKDAIKRQLRARILTESVGAS